MSEIKDSLGLENVGIIKRNVDVDSLISDAVANEGAKISSVEKNSPAEKAGLQKDDIITKLGEEKINTGNNLAVAINKLNPKDEVKISYLRNGRQKYAKVTLGEKIPSFTKSFSFNDGPRNRIITVPGYKGPKNWGAEDFNKEKFFDEYGN